MPSSEKDQFIAMLDRAGVRWTPGDSNPDAIEIETKKGPANEGYEGFVALFHFNSVSGHLERVGIWE